MMQVQSKIKPSTHYMNLKGRGCVTEVLEKSTFFSYTLQNDLT